MIAVVFVATSCVTTSNLDLNHLNFRKVGRIPVVEGKINGKKAFFIIDTGASCSILNASASEYFGFTLMHSSDQIASFTGMVKINLVKNCTVELGLLTVRNVRFRTQIMNELTGFIKQHERIEIAGILGGDFFSRYNIGIDFRRNKITY